MSRDSFDSPQARPIAALAFHHPIALLQQALALAILAFLLLLDVRAFVVGHDTLPAIERMITLERHLSHQSTSYRRLMIGSSIP
jgi:hypothetical protein